jgi:activating signal cointegrator 1
MKALSLWQPWASLWCSDRKVHETRHWPTRFRGLLLVHAAKRFEKGFDHDDPLALILRAEFGVGWQTRLPTGALIGAVKIIACKRTEDVTSKWAPEPVPISRWDDYQCGDFADGRFAFERGQFCRFDRPIPWRGAQGFFEVPDGVLGDCAVQVCGVARG